MGGTCPHPALRRQIGCQARRCAPSAQREANEPLGIRLADAHKYLWADEPGASTKPFSGGSSAGKWRNNNARAETTHPPDASVLRHYPASPAFLRENERGPGGEKKARARLSLPRKRPGWKLPPCFFPAHENAPAGPPAVFFPSPSPLETLALLLETYPNTFPKSPAP